MEKREKRRSIHLSVTCVSLLFKAVVSSLRIGLLNTCYQAMRKQYDSAKQLNNNYFAVFFHINLPDISGSLHLASTLNLCVVTT